MSTAADVHTYLTALEARIAALEAKAAAPAPQPVVHVPPPAPRPQRMQPPRPIATTSPAAECLQQAASKE